MRVVYWGTYDKGKPRNRIMLEGLRLNGVEVIECHKDVWQGVEDKSQVSGWLKKITIILRWLFSYPGLIARYLRLPRHDRVVVGYMGHLDVLVLWPFAKLRGIPIVWDAFLSLYNTVVDDRKLVGRWHPFALILFVWEWLVCHLVELIILDTAAHGRYFSNKYSLAEVKVKQVFVGVETDLFYPEKISRVFDSSSERPFNVLFYGQYIPLHGIEYIVKAAHLLRHENIISWTFIGKGQEREKIDRTVAEIGLQNSEFIDWVPYDKLLEHLHKADVCLGIFGATAKAKMVIPNKVFQIIAAGCPLITGDSCAIRELLQERPGVSLIPFADAEKLAEAVDRMSQKQARFNRQTIFADLHGKISPEAIGGQFKSVLIGMSE